MADDVVAKVVWSGLRSCGWSVEGCYSDAAYMLVYMVVCVKSRADLHNDEDGDENRCEACPGDPSDLLKLSHTRTKAHHDRRDDGEVVCAE